MRIPQDTKPDFSESQNIASELLAQTNVLQEMAQSVGDAKAILSFSGDRLKRALALAIHDAKSAGVTSFAAAEAEARASTAYRDALDALSIQERDAERQVAAWTAAQAKYEALRSLVSLAKAQSQIL
jgi:hypothetical protein